MANTNEFKRGRRAVYLGDNSPDFWSIGNRIFMVIDDGVVYVGRRYRPRCHAGVRPAGAG